MSEKIPFMLSLSKHVPHFFSNLLDCEFQMARSFTAFRMTAS